MDHRAMTLLSRGKDGWRSKEIENWNVAACPMSSAALQPDGQKLLGVWETAGKINVAWMDNTPTLPVTLAPRSAKHPAVATDREGSFLVAWVEGTGWNRGGDAAWVEVDSSLKSKSTPGHAGGVPAWGRVAVYSEGRGRFVLLR